MLGLLTKGTVLEMQLSRVLDLQSVKMQTHPATSRGRLGSALLCFGGGGWMKAICESLGDWSFQTYQGEAVGCVDRTRVLHPKSQVLGNFLQFCLFNPLLCCGTQDLCVLGRCSTTELFQPYPHPTPPRFICVYVVYFYVCAPVCTCVCTPRCWR